MHKIRVLLAEDHAIVRNGLRALLNTEPDIEVIEEAENGREAIAKAQQLHPDVVLMDISMPDLNGLEATRQLTQHCPKIKVLILTMHTDEEYVFQILRAGAAGFVIKQAAFTELLTAIKSVHAGGIFLSPVISRIVIEEYLQQAEKMTGGSSYDLLTDREREVLQLLAEGHSTKDIAERLYISIKTVETHKTHLMQKLNLHNIVELVKYAIRKGIIAADS